MYQFCELLRYFSGTVTLPNFDPWGFVDSHKKESIYTALAKRCNIVRGKSG